jgi:uncharacterized alkaline shock family protein YloU
MTDELVLSEPEGTITVPAGTLARIVAGAAERVEGARIRRPRRSIDVDVAGASATVALQLEVSYGTVLPALAETVQREVAEALETMCGLDVRNVDVAIEELV